MTVEFYHVSPPAVQGAPPNFTLLFTEKAENVPVYLPGDMIIRDDQFLIVQSRVFSRKKEEPEKLILNCLPAKPASVLPL